MSTAGHIPIAGRMMELLFDAGQCCITAKIVTMPLGAAWLQWKAGRIRGMAVMGLGLALGLCLCLTLGL